MLKLLLFAGLAACVELFEDTSVSKTVSFCGSPQDAFTPYTVQISPDPPQRGSPLSVRVSGFLSEAVEEGAVAMVTVKLGFIKLINHVYDVCAEAPQIHRSCPVDKGEFLLEETFDIPAQVPPGHYTVHIEAFLESGRPLTCVDADVHF